MFPDGDCSPVLCLLVLATCFLFLIMSYDGLDWILADLVKNWVVFPSGKYPLPNLWYWIFYLLKNKHSSLLGVSCQNGDPKSLWAHQPSWLVVASAGIKGIRAVVAILHAFCSMDYCRFLFRSQFHLIWFAFDCTGFGVLNTSADWWESFSIIHPYMMRRQQVGITACPNSRVIFIKVLLKFSQVHTILVFLGERFVLFIKNLYI